MPSGFEKVPKKPESDDMMIRIGDMLVPNMMRNRKPKDDGFKPC